MDNPPPSPFAKIIGGLIPGSGAFATRVRRMLHDRPDDEALPQMRRLQPRPALRPIVEEVANHFCHDPDDWRFGWRVNDGSRALAAYLARGHFGYSANHVAAVLGYRSHGGVSSAIARIESAGPAIKRTAEQLARKVESCLNG